MSALANNREVIKVLLADRTSAGNAMSLRFLFSYMNYTPAVEPADFDVCPVLLTQPVEDRWSLRQVEYTSPISNYKISYGRSFTSRSRPHPLEDPGLLKWKKSSSTPLIDSLPPITIVTSVRKS